MSVGSQLGTSKTQDFVILGAIALAGYVLYNVIAGIKAAGHAVGAVVSAVGDASNTVNQVNEGAYTGTVSAIASGLYALFGPQDMGTSVYYTVSFPDGSRHAIPSNTVNSDGVFIWTGYPPGSQNPVTLQLVKDSSGNWYATTP